MFVNVYTGGSTLHGVTGIYYSQGPTINFQAHENMTLNELKGQIYNLLQIPHQGNDLNIRVRYNAAPPPSVFFSELQIIDDNTWSMVVANLAHWGVMELFVDVVAVAGSDIPGPSSSRRPRKGGARARRQTIEDISVPVPDSDHVYDSSHIPSERDEEEIDLEVGLEDIQEMREFSNLYADDEVNPHDRVRHLVFSDEMPFEEISGNDNFFNEENFSDGLGDDEEIEEEDDDDDDDDEAPEASHQVYWQLARRSDTHPVSSFNAIDDIVRIMGDGSFFPNEDYATDDGLEEASIYRSKAHLKWVVHDHHIRINRTFKIKKSNASVYTIICTEENCRWRLYAARRQEDSAFVIKKRQGPHTCVVTENRRNHPHLTAPFMATIIRENIKENPHYKLKDIKVTIEQRYKFRPKYMKCWRAREIAISELFGGWNESYNLIGPLLNAIQHANPGTKVQWFNVLSRDPGVMKFQMVNWAFGPAIQAFRYCRPVIGIDGTFLTGRYKGKLLTCCGFDAEDQIVPLAFALCDKEKNSTWENFMRFVRQHVVGSRQVCVISDRHASILRVFKEPDIGWNIESREASHRYCSRHLVQNFQSKFKDKKLIPFVQKVFRENQPRKFQKRLNQLENKKRGAVKWLYEIGSDNAENPCLELWSPVHDGGYRWGMMTSNGPESLNNVFKDARALPITALVEVTFYKSVKYFADRREKAAAALANQVMFAPKVEVMLEKRRLKGNQHNVNPFVMRQKYEVITPTRLEGTTRKGGQKHQVNFHEGVATCSCLKPQLRGIPCSHVLGVCGEQGIDSNQYVSGFYSITALCNTWIHEFNMFGNPDTWPPYSGPKLIPDPILYKAEKGRRQTIRIRTDMDVTSQRKNPYTCHLCGQSGHSRRTCPTATRNDEEN